METVIIYFIKVNAILSILFFMYWGFLKNEKFFQLNRIVLIGTCTLALLLPVLPATNSLGVKDKYLDQLPFQLKAGRSLYSINPINISEKSPVAINHQVNSDEGLSVENYSWFSILQIVFWLYLFIASMLFTRFIQQLIKLFLLLRSNQQQASDGIIYCRHQKELSPFSFFNYLVINEFQFNSVRLQQILAHEKVHIRQCHTLDILFAELIHIFLWINPLALVLKKYVKLNLEYIADETVLSTGIDQKTYQLNILHSCLKPVSIPFTNPFFSPKIKLRIKMMNTKKSPVYHLYKYLCVFLVILLMYLSINPLRAQSDSQTQPDNLFASLKNHVRQNATISQKLRILEGYYQSQNNKSAFAQVIIKDNYLFVKQLWDGREIQLTQESELEFINKELKFPVKFTKDKNGAITQALAPGNEVWNKVNNYKPVIKKEVSIPEEQFKAFEGHYQLQTNKDMFIQITAREKNLILKELWSGQEITFAPESELAFFSKENTLFTLKFTKDKNGAITQVLAFGKDMWTKVNDYNPVVKKEIQLTAEQLKAFEGKYQFQFEPGRDDFIQITAKEKGIALKELWSGNQVSFVAEASLAFFSKEQPSFTLKFTKDKTGVITQVLAFNKDLWTKVKE